jgi:hypothetical protein
MRKSSCLRGHLRPLVYHAVVLDTPARLRVRSLSVRIDRGESGESPLQRSFDWRIPYFEDRDCDHPGAIIIDKQVAVITPHGVI